MSETWTNRLSNVDLSGLQHIHSFRKYQHCRTKRSSGGIVIYIRNEISKGVKVVLNQIDCLIWLKVDKNYFNIEQDLYLGCVYIAPESSPVHHMYDIDIFRQIEHDIGQFCDRGKVLKAGDMNARVGQTCDYINNDRP